MSVNVPSLATRKKYGLSEDEWRAILDRQGGVCAICERVPSTGRLCIDHEHVRGWKKLPPDQRKLYVRGLLCWVCNHYYLGRGITIAKARNVVSYLGAYEGRIAQNQRVAGNLEWVASSSTILGGSIDG